MNEPQTQPSVPNAPPKRKLMSDGIVIFFGAGASRCEGYPLMGTFLDDLKASFPLGNDPPDQRRRKAFETLLTFRSELASAKDYVQTDFDNIESLYCAADMYALAFPNKSIWVTGEKVSAAHIPSKIALAIWEMCRWNPRKKFVHEDPKTHIDLFSVLKRRFDDGRFTDLYSHMTFITTNYDLLVELALWKCKLPFSYGSSVSFDDFLEGFAYREASASLLKLHGSVNWFKKHEEGDDFSTICDASLSQYLEHPRTQSPYSWPKLQSRNYDLPGDPLIVPPTYAKSAGDNILENVWREAITATATAKLLIFIGYSFPPTDTFLQHLLNVSFLQNRDLRKVLIVNPDPEVGKHLRTSIFNSNFAEKKLEFLEARFEEQEKGVIGNIAQAIEYVERKSNA